MQLTGTTEIQRLVAGTLEGQPCANAVRIEERVTAVITVESDMRFLPSTLHAVLGQSVVPATIVIADCSGQTLQSVQAMADVACAQGTSSIAIQIVKVAQAKSFGDAVAKAVRNASIDTASRTLWLLHDDSRPADSRCLERLLEAWSNTPTAAILGAKQLDWQGRRLHSVGAYEGHHRVCSLVVDGEPDQEQYDGRQDVFAVSLAGALVPDHTLADARGINPWFTTFAESQDFCRRLCLAGKRVVVVPQARIAHRRARYDGVRTHDGRPLDPQQPQDTTMARLSAIQKYRYTDMKAPWWPLAWLWGIIVAVRSAVRQLFAKYPYRAWCRLCMPWIALAGIPGALGARSRIQSAGAVSRADLAMVKADRGQIRQWKAATREFHDDEERDVLNPLALAHLRARRIRRWSLAAIAALLAFGVVAAMYWTILRYAFSDASLYSDTLLPTGASFGQLAAAATTPWAFGTGTGTPAPPTPFLLVVLVASLCTGGNVAASLSLIFFLSAPAMVLSFWALAGVVTRSDAVRVIAALAWFAMAMALGFYADANLPMLCVMVFLPAAFAFSCKAVGMYRTEQPVNPRASVQAAAVSALLYIPVVAAEPQLLLALVVVFLAFVVLVRSHRLKLLLIPLPAAFALAPTIVNCVKYPQMWRQLFGDVMTPSRSANGTPAVRNLLSIASDALGITGGIDLFSASAWSDPEDVRAILILALLAAFLIVAVFALARPSLFRASHIAWIAIACGMLLAIASGAVTIGVASWGDAGGSAMPGFVMALMGVFICMCMMAGPAVKRFAELNAANGTRSLNRTASLLVALALAAMATLGGWAGYARQDGGSVAITGTGLPMVAQEYLSQDPDRRVLALCASSSNTVEYAVMRTSRGDLIDVSPAERVRFAFDAETNPENDRIALLGGRLLANADSDAIDELASLGFGGIYVVEGSAASAKASDQLISNITSSSGAKSVVSNDSGEYFRVSSDDGADARIDTSWQMATQSSPWRVAWLWCLGIIVALYLVAALPRRHRTIREEA